MPTDLNCLSYWFPRLVDAGIPVPRTEIVTTDVDLLSLLDGEVVPAFGDFLRTLVAAADRIGWPLFLRTGHLSGKHDWIKTCYVARASDLGQHVANLVEASELAHILGLPTGVWAVREFLHLRAAFTAFEGMPVALEYRAFIKHGDVQCVHPYWPMSAIRKPSCEDWRERLYDLYAHADRDLFHHFAIQVARVFEGHWSVDVCQTQNGKHYVTDMALGDDSWHWPTCPHAPKEEPEAACEPIKIVRRPGA